MFVLVRERINHLCSGCIERSVLADPKALFYRARAKHDLSKLLHSSSDKLERIALLQEAKRDVESLLQSSSKDGDSRLLRREHLQFELVIIYASLSFMNERQRELLYVA